MLKIDTKLVAAAQEGDQHALETLLLSVQDQVHNLSMRMLVNPDDAREATQEVLILVLTKLSTFRHESAFSTWVYRVAANYLMAAKKIRDRDPGLSFAVYAADLEGGLMADPPAAPDDALMINELRISCTMAMLLCLDLNHRIAYVLGDILEIDHLQAAEILEITATAYRKRLSRARQEVVGFTSNHCGIVETTAKCSCPRRLPAARRLGRVRPDNISYACHDAHSYEDVQGRVDRVVGGLKALELQRGVQGFVCPPDMLSRIKEIISPRG